MILPTNGTVVEYGRAVRASISALVAKGPFDDGELDISISLNSDQIFVHTSMFLTSQYVETIWSRSKARAKKAGIEFALTRSDIANMTVPITCPVLGMPLRMERGRRTDNSLSIDRIDSKRGYTPDNVVFVSWRVNWLKGNASLDEMQKMVKFYESIAVDKADAHLGTTLDSNELDPTGT